MSSSSLALPNYRGVLSRRIEAAAARRPGAAFALALACASAAFAQQPALRSFPIDASTLSPSSPHQWLLGGVISLPGASGGLDLALDPAYAPALRGGVGREAEDLYLSFDGAVPSDAAGRWSATAVGPYAPSTPAEARRGSGAGVFRAPATKLVLEPRASELFRPGDFSADFSMEFWLRPSRAENGEIVLLWKATQERGRSRLAQQITVLVQRSRLTFGFLNFFADPSGKETAFSLQAVSLLPAGRWSHHLVRFDAATGLLEHLMDGKPEAVAYATSTGRQGGSVFLPLGGSAGRMELAPNYTGFLDEFRLVNAWVERPALSRYDTGGGTATSPIFDLGNPNSLIARIDAQAAEPGEAAVQWEFRAADSSAGWRDSQPAWLPFVPGAALAGPDGKPIRARYLQLRLSLYPDAAGERSPRIFSVSAAYEPDLPPAPPSRLLLTPGDGSLRVEWTRAVEADVRGYVLYYGTASREYFGADAAQGPSPIWIPGRDAVSYTLRGLRNGTLYFVAVAAYDGAEPPQIGEFSAESGARPSRISP